MATDGIPEPASQRCGNEIARLRTLRGWSRARLIGHLFDALDPGDPTFDHISEAWLKRLENGYMVKVLRHTTETLCQALGCTPRERARLLLYADRNIFGHDEVEPNAVAEALTYAMEQIYTEAHDILADVIGQRRAAELDEKELLELTITAIELVLRQRWPR
jgi:transcriptional regulator with XRE-family HTH domain